jgi:hypothetical protein
MNALLMHLHGADIGDGGPKPSELGTDTSKLSASDADTVPIIGRKMSAKPTDVML